MVKQSTISNKRWLAVVCILVCIFLTASESQAKIYVERSGPHMIEYQQLLSYFSATIDPRHLALTTTGKAVAIKVDGEKDGKFDSQDKIWFYGIKGQVYWLRIDKKLALRWQHLSTKSSQKYTPQYTRVQRWDKDRVWAYFPYEKVPIKSRMDHHMQTKADKFGRITSLFTVDDCLKNDRAILQLRVLHSYTNTDKNGIADIFFNNKLIGNLKLGPGSYNKTFRVDINKGYNSLQLKLRVGSYLPTYLDWFQLTYPAYFSSSGEISGIKNQGKSVVLSHQHTFSVFSDKGEYEQILSGKSYTIPKRRKIYYWRKGTYQKAKISQNTPPIIPVEGLQYLVIVPQEFLPAIDTLVKLRSQQYKTKVVTVEAIYDHFDYGRQGNQAIHNFITAILTRWPAPDLQYILLAADATRNRTTYFPVVPSCIVETYYDGGTTTDYPYVKTCLKHGFKVALGRLPARNTRELKQIVDKIANFENIKRGKWQQRINFVAGQGYYGEVADSFLEYIFQRLITRYVPPFYDISMTYGSPKSPYFYIPSQFHKKVVERLNQGALFFVYIGHGQRKGLGKIKLGKKQRYSILSNKDIASVAVQEGMPIMVSIACSTAYFDHPWETSIGEKMLLANKGPVAFIGSTRRSHPYPNALIGKAFLESLFEDKVQTIGGLLNSVNESLTTPAGFDMLRFSIDNAAKLFTNGGPSLERLREEHLYLYHVLGDPATPVIFPKPELKLKVKDEIKTLSISLEQPLVILPDNNSIKVSLYLPMQKISGKIYDIDLKDPKSQEYIRHNYKTANSKELTTSYTSAFRGNFSASLRVPGNLKPGTYYIKVSTVVTNRLFVGSKMITIDRVRK